MRNTRSGINVVKNLNYGLFTLVLSASAFGMQTTSIAHQDIAGLVGHNGKDRWLVHLEQQTGESVANLQEADNGVDTIITSSINGSLTASRKIVRADAPQKINRAIKGSRVVQTTARQAPEKFSAGSVLERQSFLAPLDLDKKTVLAFVKPKPHEEAYQVAAIFHPKKKKRALPETKHLPVQVASLVKQSQSSVLSYAPEPKKEYSPFSAILKETKPVKIVPKLAKGDHRWAADPLPKNSFSKRQQACLAQGIYFEARGEPVKGQAAVAQVILNRVRNPHYPNTICGVVYQNKHWYNRCQFSFACDRIRDRVNDRKRYRLAEHVAMETTSGRIWLPNVGSSTHYHATYVRPRWARTMKRVGKIGLHIFYRTYGGGWS